MSTNTKKYANSGPGWADVAFAMEAFERKWGRHVEYKVVGQVSGRRATGRLVVSVWTQREAHKAFDVADKRYEAEVYSYKAGTLPSHCLRLLTLLERSLEEATPLLEQTGLFAAEG